MSRAQRTKYHPSPSANCPPRPARVDAWSRRDRAVARGPDPRHCREFRIFPRSTDCALILTPDAWSSAPARPGKPSSLESVINFPGSRRSTTLPAVVGAGDDDKDSAGDAHQSNRINGEIKCRRLSAGRTAPLYCSSSASEPPPVARRD